jgi:hypothetical protein
MAPRPWAARREADVFGWLRRLAPEPALPSVRSDPALGIGGMVIVLSDLGSTEAWEGTPTGVIVAVGERELVGYPNHRAGAAGSWLIAFDEPTYKTDGRGPYDRASVPARLLVPAPLVEEWVLEG